MYLPFEQLSDEARVWVYQANRLFEQQELAEVMGKAQTFLTDWASHGNPLQGSATILHNQFLIIAVEESFQGATGCAVDASIQFIRELEESMQLSMLDRTQVAFQQDGENIVVPLAQLPTRIRQGTINAEMLTFDNTITKKQDLATKWLIRAEDAWFGRYFNLPA